MSTVRPFDLGEYTRTAHGSHRDAVGDVSALDADDLALVALLRDLESGTMAYFRRVLVTPTHKDARVTAFLVTWSYERFWIADALGAVLDAAAPDAAPAAALEAAAHQTDAPSPSPARAPQVRGHRRARRGPVRRALGAFFSGQPLVAAHLTSLAVDGAVLEAALRSLACRLAGRRDHRDGDQDAAGPAGPVGAAGATVPAGTPGATVTPGTHGTPALFERLADVHARQGGFLVGEASVRLAGSSKAVGLAVRELRDEAYPLGLADRPAADRERFAQAAFPGRGGAWGAPELEVALESVAALPGLRGAVARASAALASRSTRT